MNSQSSTMKSTQYHKWVIWLVCGLAMARVAGLVASPLNLHGDEAQYWSWSRSLEWGYFSKPPLIAWMIALTTAVFGDAEWAVRISSPVLHSVIAYILFRTARFLYGGRTGFYAACIYLLMPAVWLSSGIVSTDVPLLLCWTAALNAWVHLRNNTQYKWAIVLGLSVGLGVLSKYAMLFFLPVLLILIFIDTKTKSALISKKGILAAGIALILVFPNIAWNVTHDYATFSHTAANANWKGIPFHPDELIEFWGSQFAVFGPLTMLLLCAAGLAAIGGRLGQEARFLFVFVLVPVLVISIEALLSRANANWAVTAYIGGTLLSALALRHLYQKFGKIGIVVNILLGFIVCAGALVPEFANSVGQANAFKRMRAWPQTAQEVEKIARAGHNHQPYISIATDNRLVFYNLFYYGHARHADLPLYMWLLSANVNNHAEFTASLPAGKYSDGPVLIINYYDNYENKFREDFESLEELSPIAVPLGGGKVRNLRVWAGYGYTPTREVTR